MADEIEIKAEDINKSIDYYSTSSELGVTWEEINPEFLSAHDYIIGYDPVFVTFVDESQSRTFPLGSWELDFGDGCLYGLTSAERFALSAKICGKWGGDNYWNDTSYSNAISAQRTKYGIDELSSVFRIPGDMELLNDPMLDAETYTEKQSLKQFYATNIMNPADYKRETIRYPSSAGENPGNVHVTTIVLSGDSVKTRDDYYGNVDGVSLSPVFLDDEDSKFQYDECFKTVATGGHVYFDSLVSDDCSQIGANLAIDPKMRPVFGHMYKGPGVYTSVYKIKPHSMADYYGQELAESNFRHSGLEYLTKTVVVRPVCPCMRIRIYDNYLRNPSNNKIRVDPRSGHKVFDRVVDDNGYSRLMHAALSSDSYSADDPENFGGDDYSYIDFNPEIFSVYNRNHEKIFEGVSGYAPFVRASCKAMVRPNSFPISAASIDHGDWFTDRIRDEEFVEISGYKSGWPYWAPSSVNGGFWNDRKRAVEFYNTHTFVMPGLYKAKVNIGYDMERVPDFWHGELSSCANSDTGAYYVLVKEIMPKKPVIKNTFKESTVSGDTLFNFKFDVSAGSFPIEDVVWDFADGSEKFKLSRNISYDSRVVYGDNTTATYCGPLSAYFDEQTHEYSFNPSSNDYGALDASAGSAYAASVGTSGVYAELDPRDWMIEHRFYKTSLQELQNVVVSAIGYVCNTHTMTLGTYEIAIDALPDFKSVEGSVRVIDTRLAGDTDDIVVTFEGKNNGNETNLYSIKWESNNE